MKKDYIVLMTVVTMLVGCGGVQKNQEPSVNDSVSVGQVDRSRDSVQDHESAPLTHKTMGKVVASRYADMSFETALPIEQVFVRNGQQVRRGQVLARLDQFKLRNTIEQQHRAIEQAQLQMEQAHLQMQDVIIAQGFDPDKVESVPSHVLHNADVKSGYALSKAQLAAARTQLAAAQHELRSGVLTAPFDGVVANLSVQAHQLAQAGQTVCRVIATGDMEVEFRVMESDLNSYKLGTSLVIVPVADQSQQYTATVSEINPVVDEQGAVKLRARLGAASGLFDGMNVEVILKLQL